MQGIEKVFVTLQTRIMSDNIEKANFGGELLKHREEFETRNGYEKYGDIVPFETAQIDGSLIVPFEMAQIPDVLFATG